ncbi:MAG: cell envelope integrity protein TolA [Gammaproteobacteria bacterium]|nr:cell envelope integrity protein TolA [Gammaproteobacteria bacterium]
MLEIIRKYPRAIFYAVIVHAALIAVMVMSFKWSDKAEYQSKDKGEEIVRATTVDAKKIEKELKKIKAAEHEKQRELEQAAKKAEKARLREEKKLAEAKNKRIAEQKALENKRKEEQDRLKELETKRKTEEERLEKVEQQKREEELRNKLKAEEERLAKESNKQRQSTINQYKAMINAKVYQNWVIPSSATDGMVCTVKVRLIPSGDVIQVQLTSSSGDDAFDRSVENAVRKASPLPVPPADSGLFDAFRELDFNMSKKKEN